MLLDATPNDQSCVHCQSMEFERLGAAFDVCLLMKGHSGHLRCIFRHDVRCRHRVSSPHRNSGHHPCANRIRPQRDGPTRRTESLKLIRSRLWQARIHGVSCTPLPPPPRSPNPRIRFNKVVSRRGRAIDAQHGPCHTRLRQPVRSERESRSTMEVHVLAEINSNQNHPDRGMRPLS